MTMISKGLLIVLLESYVSLAFIPDAGIDTDSLEL